MTACLLHPEAAAAGSCEYCDQPHCGSCLRPLLGRSYCPACYEKVRALALGAPPAPAAIPVAPAASPAPAAAIPAAPGAVPVWPPERAAAEPARLPGWVSALLYLVGFVIGIKGVVELLLAAPLLVAQYAAGGLQPGRGANLLLDASRIGLSTWTLLFLLFGWGSLLATLAFTALLANTLERRRLKDLGLWAAPTLPRDMLLGLGLAAVLFISVVGTGAARNWYLMRGVVPALDALAITVGGFLAVLPLAMGEEIAMRGYVLHAVQRSWGKAAGVAASTAAFALLHASNPSFQKHPLALLGLLLAGLYLAAAYHVTGNLWLAIFLHTGWNLMEGPIFGLPVSGLTVPASVFRTTTAGPDLWTGGSFGPEAGLLLCLLLIVHLGVLWALRPILRPDEGAVQVSPTLTAG